MREAIIQTEKLETRPKETSAYSPVPADQGKRTDLSEEDAEVHPGTSKKRERNPPASKNPQVQ